jgi:hypothetical protein
MSTLQSVASFNERDVAQFYRWLDHHIDEYTEIRVIDPNGDDAHQFFIQSQETFLEICRRWSGQRHVYAGINPRKREGGTAADVARVTAFMLDVDAPKSQRNQSATDNEKQVAWDRLHDIEMYLAEGGFTQPYIDDSGNGYHIGYKLDLPVTDAATLTTQLNTFFQEIKQEFPYLDNISDLPRIIKIPGTMSLKGLNTRERPHRLASIIQLGDQSPNQTLQNYILQLAPGADTVNLMLNYSTSITPEKLARLRPCMQHFIAHGGRFTAKGDRDAECGARQSFYSEMIEAGFAESEILTASQAFDDFDAQKCRYELQRIYREKIAQGEVKPWRCETLQKHQICLGNECPIYPHNETSPSAQSAVTNASSPQFIEYGSKQHLYAKINNYLTERLDLIEDIHYDILAAKVFESWVIDRVNVISYIFFLGPTGSGKTTAGETCAELCYQNLHLASATAAYILRKYTEGPHTLFLDEVQQYLESDERTKFMAILNAGYRRGMRAGLTRPGKSDWEPAEYETFGLKFLSSTEGTIPTLRRRCIVIEMARNVKPIHVVKDTSPLPTLRGQLAKFRHDFLTDIPQINFATVEKLFRRAGCNDNTVIENLLNLYVVMPNDARRRLLAYAKDLDETARDNEESLYYKDLFDAVYGLWQAQPGEAPKKIGVSAIADAYNTTNQQSLDVRNIGRDLIKMGFATSCRMAGNKVGRKITERFMRRQLKRYRPGEAWYADAERHQDPTSSTTQQRLDTSRRGVGEFGELEEGKAQQHNADCDTAFLSPGKLPKLPHSLSGASQPPDVDAIVRAATCGQCRHYVAGMQCPLHPDLHIAPTDGLARSCGDYVPREEADTA